jgi:hypothetical protein
MLQNEITLLQHPDTRMQQPLLFTRFFSSVEILAPLNLRVLASDITKEKLVKHPIFQQSKKR